MLAVRVLQIHPKRPKENPHKRNKQTDRRTPPRPKTDRQKYSTSRQVRVYSGTVQYREMYSSTVQYRAVYSAGQRAKRAKGQERRGRSHDGMCKGRGEAHRAWQRHSLVTSCASRCPTRPAPPPASPDLRIPLHLPPPLHRHRRTLPRPSCPLCDPPPLQRSARHLPSYWARRFVQDGSGRGRDMREGRRGGDGDAMPECDDPRTRL